jgi:hypothetical protein
MSQKVLDLQFAEKKFVCPPFLIRLRVMDGLVIMFGMVIMFGLVGRSN